MGVAVLTLRGNDFLSRVGESVVSNAGYREWIATDRQDYVVKGVEFASDLTGLAETRRSLRQRVLESPLFDGKRFAKDFQAAVRGMWAEQPDLLRSNPSLKKNADLKGKSL